MDILSLSDKPDDNYIKLVKNFIREYKQKRDDCTTILSEYRKKLKIAHYILDDTPKVKEVIKIEKQMAELQQIDINRVRKRDKRVKY